MSEDKVQLAVIGAGPGGYPAAFYAADLGLDVVLIEKDETLGGVCLNRGCIPSKALLHVARVMDEAKVAASYGVTFSDPKIDLGQLRQFKNDVITKLNGGVKALSKARKVKVLKGEASFASENQLSIKTKKGEKKLSFDHCIIATGSSPIVPKALALNSPRVMDSTGALELPDIPERFLVVGGGVIGLELGTVYSALGSKVSVVEALPELAAPVDRDLFRPLEKKLKQKFERILTSHKVVSMSEEGEAIRVLMEGPNGEKVEEVYDRVLLCIGRAPNSKSLQLESAGIQVNDRGFIEVNRSLRTANEKVFAIGDVVPGPMLAHKASREGKIAVECITGKRALFDNVGIPSVIYTDPEIAWVGLTEKEAQEKKISYKVGKFPWAASGRALTEHRTDGLTKILFEPETERVLGVGMAGLSAGELIAEATLALELGCSVQDLSETIHAHPTLSETFMESAEALHGMATHIYTKK